MTLKDRFWAKASIPSADCCWEWQAATKGGKHPYGVIGIGRRGEGVARAHVLAYEWAFGPIPDGLNVCHKCDNPRCVNPEHLFLGTHGDNRRDCRNKGRSVDHPRQEGAANVNAKLTEDLVRYIRQYPSGQGSGLLQLARDLGISYSTVKRVRSGKVWKWLSRP